MTYYFAVLGNEPDENNPNPDIYLTFASDNLEEVTKTATESGKNWKIVELYIPIETFYAEYVYKDSGHTNQADYEFLSLNESYKQKLMMEEQKKLIEASNLIAQGLRDSKSPMSKLDSDLGTNIVAFFGRKEPDIEGKIKKTIDKSFTKNSANIKDHKTQPEKSTDIKNHKTQQDFKKNKT